MLAFALCGAHARAGEAYTPTPLTASEIFAKAKAATGTLASGTFRRVQRAIVGGAEHTYTTIMRGDEYRETIAGGGFTSSVGYVDKQSWTQNENGIVTLRNDFHAKVDPNELAVEHPDDPKYHVRVLGITASLPHRYAVELNPPGGYDEYLYYDASTFLLAKIVSYPTDRYRHVETYSDYRRTFGKMFAYRTHSYDGRPQNDDVTTTVSFEPDTTPHELAMPAGRTLFSYTGKPIVIPATFTRGGVILHTSVNGRGLDFVLDSGASGLFIDPGIAHQLGLTPFGRSSETIGGGDIDLGLVRLPEMKIGPLTLRHPVFTTSPFQEQDGNARAIGLIGFDFLASGIFEFDFKAGTLTLYPRDTFDPKALGLRALPLQLDDGIPRADAWIEGVHGHFAVDTGAFNMLVYRNFVKKLPSHDADGSTQMGTVGGTMKARLIQLTDLIFGGIRFHHATALMPVGSTFDLSDYDGLLGRDVLANYKAYFDYGDGLLYVKPNL